MIRLLLDENVPYSTRERLAEAGFDVAQARDVNLCAARDTTVLASAASDDRAIVTHDADFSQ